MEIRSTQEARGQVEEFAKRIIEKLLEKKSIDEDIKEIKEEFKEEGVPVGIVTAMVSKIKARKKKSDSELFEEETIQEWLEANADVDNLIGELID